MAKKPEWGIEREADLPWCLKKVTLFKALRAMRATDTNTARSSTEITRQSGLSGRDVRHYSYHAAAGGLVGITKVEGHLGNCFYLTRKGQAVDLEKVLRELESTSTSL